MPLSILVNKYDGIYGRYVAYCLQGIKQDRAIICCWSPAANEGWSAVLRDARTVMATAAPIDAFVNIDDGRPKALLNEATAVAAPARSTKA